VEGFAYRAFGLDPVEQVVARTNTGDASGETPMLDSGPTTAQPTTLKTTFVRGTARTGEEEDIRT